MLEMFSTSLDKSMDLNDFTRMMIVAKLAWKKHTLWTYLLGSLHWRCPFHLGDFYLLVAWFMQNQLHNYALITFSSSCPNYRHPHPADRDPQIPSPKGPRQRQPPFMESRMLGGSFCHCWIAWLPPRRKLKLTPKILERTPSPQIGTICTGDLDTYPHPSFSPNRRTLGPEYLPKPRLTAREDLGRNLLVISLIMSTLGGKIMTRCPCWLIRSFRPPIITNLSLLCNQKVRFSTIWLPPQTPLKLHILLLDTS